MAYFDFPHTRNYDSDLGFLIDQYKSLTAVYTDIQNNIESTVTSMITSGKIQIKYTYTADTETISFSTEVTA